MCSPASGRGRLNLYKPRPNSWPFLSNSEGHLNQHVGDGGGARTSRTCASPAMEVHGAASREQQQHDGGGGGVKVKFIETQFVSSDAASFKAVVQRLTGQSAPSPSAPATSARPSRPRARAAVTACPAAAVGWAGGYGGGSGLMTMAAPVKQEAAAPPPNLEDLHELRDFSDLFYPTSAGGGGRRVDGGGYGYPYY